MVFNDLISILNWFITAKMYSLVYSATIKHKKVIEVVNDNKY